MEEIKSLRYIDSHVRRQNIRNQVFAQIHIVRHEHHFGRRFLVQPAANHRPDCREDRRRIEDQTNAHSLRIVSAQQPDDVLDQLIVHAAGIETGQIEDDAQIVGNLFEAASASSFLWFKIIFILFVYSVSALWSYQAVHNELGQFIQIPFGHHVIFGRNIDDRTSGAIAMPQDTGFAGVQSDGRIGLETLDAVLLTPFVRFEYSLMDVK